ncbi:PglZ domain-containing protein, partial [bacterium]|nr:PglZ domain-containing protein [bacterium]
MIDKWFREDVDSILKEKNRIVVVAEDENAGFLHNFIPSKYKIYKTSDEIEELKIKYEIEKKCADKKVVIFTSTSREKLTFIREYCEICGCIDVKYLHNYVKEKVYNKLGLNLQLASDEIATAAKISVGKNPDYWLDIVHKGSDRLFDIGDEMLPFLNDPEVYCKKLDEQVKKEFFARLNKWLGRDNIEQPPVTLAKEAAEKILGSLVLKDGKRKFKDVYKKWADSKKYENSLGHYMAEAKLSYGDDIWGIDVSHPFTDIDRKWLLDISKNLSDEEFIKEKLDIIQKRAADKTGKKLCETLWLDVLSLLEFDATQINSINNFEEILKFYTEQFYILDSALRRLYSEFLNEKDIIQPFQEYYNDILIQFLDKWYINYGGYQENQTGFIEGIIDNSQEKCAIIVGDGISYEISRIVSEKLKDKYKTDCGFKLADFPSTTENNMSRLYIGSGEIEPFQKKREEFLKNKYKEDIRFMRLDEVSYSTESNQYLICTYKDIDDIAEKMQQNALKFISQMEDELAEKIEQLIMCGYKKVYLTSDHGFVLTGLLSESDKVEFDFTGKIEKSERYV